MSDKLLKLQSEKTDILRELDILSAEEKLTSRKLAKKRTELGVLNRRIAGLEKQATNKTQVSDHAVVRYLERVRGINIDELRAEICPSQSAEAAAVIGLGEISVVRNDGTHYLWVRGGVVTTITLEPQKRR